MGIAIQGRRSFFKGAEGWGWQFKGADLFLGRRGVGMAIQGRRSFLKGAEGWGWQFKGADSLH